MDGHDNDADKATGTGGAQGIFSTPELTVDTEKLAQNTKQNERSRVASIFANTDAGQRSQKLDDAMGLDSIAPAQVTEDITINNAPRKRSKAPIIIAVVALLAVIGGVTAWMVMKNINKPQAEEHSTIEQTKEQFTQYATYLLFGKEEDHLTGEYSSARFYTLDEQMSSSDEANEYWNTLLKQLDISLDSFNSTGINDQYLTNYLETHRQNMNFLNASRKVGDPSEEYLISQFSDNGTEKAKAALKEYFFEFTKLDQRTSAQMYYDYKIEQYAAFLDAIQMYNEAGCLVDATLDDNCVNQMVDTANDPLMQALTRMEESKLAAQEIIDETLRTVESDCWRINTQFDELLNKPKTEEEV